MKFITSGTIGLKKEFTIGALTRAIIANDVKIFEAREFLNDINKLISMFEYISCLINYYWWYTSEFYKNSRVSRLINQNSCLVTKIFLTQKYITAVQPIVISNVIDDALKFLHFRHIIISTSIIKIDFMRRIDIHFVRCNVIMTLPTTRRSWQADAVRWLLVALLCGFTSCNIHALNLISDGFAASEALIVRSARRRS